MRFQATLLVIPALALLTGCANTTFLGHQESVALAVEYKPDPSEPVDIHFGFKERVAVAVPPKESLPLGQLHGVSNVHKGDLVSTISRFQILRTRNEAGFVQAGNMRIVTGVASGLAAQNVTTIGGTTTVGVRPQAGTEASRTLIAAMKGIVTKTPPVVIPGPVPQGVFVAALGTRKREVGTIIRRLTPTQAAAALRILEPQGPLVSPTEANEQLAARVADATSNDELTRIENAARQARSGGSGNSSGTQDPNALRPVVNETLGAKRREVGALVRGLNPAQAAAALRILEPQGPPILSSEANEQLAARVGDATSKEDLARIEIAARQARSSGGDDRTGTQDPNLLRREVGSRLRSLSPAQAAKALTLLGASVPENQAQEELAGKLGGAATIEEIRAIDEAIKKAK